MIIKITAEDIKKQQQPAAGWHLLEVVKAEEAASKDMKSMNYTVTCEIKQGTEEGKYCYVRMNSKAIGMIGIPFISALLDISEDKFQPDEFDFDKLVGKRCWGEITDDTYDGKIQKRVEKFASVSSGPAF